MFKMMNLPELARILVTRTGDADFIKIAYSSMPQLRYDSMVFAALSNPEFRAVFTEDELRQLVERIQDPAKRARGLDMLNCNYY